MTSSELLIFKVFDTSDEVDVRFTAHSAFLIQTPPQALPLGQSIEMRALVFFLNQV